MNDPRLPRIIFFVMLALGLLEWAHSYPQLPERMASHFAADDTPNGWQPKEMFFVLMTFVTALSALPVFLVPAIIAAKSDAQLNLPRKDYWMAPEHREETFRFIKAFMGWFGCSFLFVLLYGTSQAIKANLPGVGHFDSQGMFYVVGGFLLLTLLGVVYFVRHFYNVPPSASEHK